LPATKKIIRTSCILLCMISSFFVLGCEGVLFPLPYRSLSPFKGMVVDSDTKKPIEGAVVLALYYYEIYGIAGADLILKDGQETVTDENGEFELPRTRRWFVLHRGYPEGKIIIFKPNYGQFPKNRKSEALGVNKSWPPPDKYIVYELPRLTTVKERKESVDFDNVLNVFHDIPFQRKKLFVQTLNEERKKLSLPLEVVPE
jgi:hypothetical protein